MPRMGNVVILCPMVLEERAVTAALKDCAPPFNAQVYLIGVRAIKLPVNLGNIQGVILAGLGGALDPALRCGDVVLDDELWPRLHSDANIKRGKICASATVVGTPAAKARLHRQTGAIAVDMEADVVRAWAARMGVHLAVLRAIVDEAGEEVDPALLGLVDEFGNVKPGAVAERLLKKPGRMGDLRRMGKASNLAGRELGKAVGDFLKRMES